MGCMIIYRFQLNNLITMKLYIVRKQFKLIKYIELSQLLAFVEGLLMLMRSRGINDQLRAVEHVTFINSVVPWQL